MESLRDPGFCRCPLPVAHFLTAPSPLPAPRGSEHADVEGFWLRAFPFGRLDVLVVFGKELAVVVGTPKLEKPPFFWGVLQGKIHAAC